MLFMSDIKPNAKKNKYKKKFRNTNNFKALATNVDDYTFISPKIGSNKTHNNKEMELLLKISSSEYQLY